jgi:hypothetical protein
MLLKNRYYNIYMKNSISLVVVSLMAVLLLGFASATGDTTAIAGKIYNADYTAIVPGATVEITCGGSLQTVESKIDGTYSVNYDSEGCHEGSTLSVHAFKEGVGENTVTGNIYDDYPVPELDLNLGVVNVPLVPEFGLIVGVLTILGAVGVFFVVRRR